MALCALAITAHRLNCSGQQVFVVLEAVVPATLVGQLTIVGVLLGGNRPAQ